MDWEIWFFQRICQKTLYLILKNLVIESIKHDNENKDDYTVRALSGDLDHQHLRHRGRDNLFVGWAEKNPEDYFSYCDIVNTGGDQETLGRLSDKYPSLVAEQSVKQALKYILKKKKSLLMVWHLKKKFKKLEQI